METPRELHFEYQAEEEKKQATYRNYLLVVGINKYQDKKIPTLYNATKDAKQVQAVLTQCYGFEADKQVILYDEKATLENITYHLREMTKKVSDKDNFLFYFAGHGYLDKTTDIGYLIPSDAKENVISSYLPNSTILDLVRAIKSLHTFLMLDACFSGSLLRKRSVDSSEQMADNLEKYASRTALAAGMIEVVADGHYKDNSPFAKALLAKLRNNTQAKMPESELIQYVKTTVPNNANQQPCAGTLFDTGDLQGEFIFRRTDAAATILENGESHTTHSQQLNRNINTNKNLVDKTTKWFKNNKITGAILLVVMFITGLGGLVEAVKNISEVGKTENYVKETKTPQTAQSDTPQPLIHEEKAKEITPITPSASTARLHENSKKTPTISPMPSKVSAEKETKPAEEAVKTPSKPAQPESTNETAVLTLVVNAPYAKADIWVDGKPAEVVQNSLSIKKLRIPKGNHHLALKAASKTCEQTVNVLSDTKINVTCL